MARRVFFSFHYQRDIFRVNVVRNCWCTHPNRESAGYWDSSLWEKSKLQGAAALQNLITEGLRNTSVTVVLIGHQTWDRRWVLYEIEQSYYRGNGLLGISIHNIANQSKLPDMPGFNPFDYTMVNHNGAIRALSSVKSIPIYDWVRNDGYRNLGSWVESVAPNRI
jgi:hypothetical protein